MARALVAEERASRGARFISTSLPNHAGHLAGHQLEPAADFFEIGGGPHHAVGGSGPKGSGRRVADRISRTAPTSIQKPAERWRVLPKVWQTRRRSPSARSTLSQSSG